MIKREIKVEGMTCENCKAKVISTLLSVDEVESVDVILEKGIIIVTLSIDTPDEVITDKLAEDGYTVVAIKEEEV